MKQLLSLIFLAAFSANPLFAGGSRMDSSKQMAAPMLQQACSWTGFYVGIHGGFGGGDLTFKDVDFSDREFLTHEATNGFFGGGQIGYNYQWGQSLVLGIEGEFSGGDIGQKQVQRDNNNETDTFDFSNDWTGAVALRLGFTSMNNRLLTYLKAGASFHHWSYDWTHDEGSNVDTFNTDEVRAAPMLGFGLEYMLTCHWTVKAEYKHVFLGTATIEADRLDDGRLEPESYDSELHQDSIALGVNYKF